MRNYLKEKLREAAPLEGHRLRITFIDGFSGEVDLAPLLDEGPLYEPLRDLQIFAPLQFPGMACRNGRTILIFRRGRFAPGARPEGY